jgi:hypothetical protein
MFPSLREDNDGRGFRDEASRFEANLESSASELALALTLTLLRQSFGDFVRFNLHDFDLSAACLGG